jgi:NitT/TauT family transport system substrate-binding protein
MRRLSTIALLGAGLAALAATAGVAQDRPLKKVVFAITTRDVSVGHAAHSSLPQALGFWKEEGLDVQVTSVEGSAAGLQQLGAGNINLVSIGPEEIVIGREKGVKIKGFYVQARLTIYRIVVPDDSPIKAVADLKGKTVGVPSLASGSVPFARALIASVGVDPEKDVKFLAVGTGAPGRLALEKKQVDALALWDSLQAELENSGMTVRRLDTPFVNDMIGQTLAARDDTLAESSAIAVGFARGVAKATVFALANPEAAIRIHWKAYWRTRPQANVAEARALREALRVFHSRFELQRVDTQDDKRFGFASPAQWERLVAILRDQKIVSGGVPASELYTSALIDEINRFDQAAIVKMARDYKP